jgi:hypothetical protein
LDKFLKKGLLPHSVPTSMPHFNGIWFLSCETNGIKLLVFFLIEYTIYPKEEALQFYFYISPESEVLINVSPETEAGTYQNTRMELEMQCY